MHMASNHLSQTARTPNVRIKQANPTMAVRSAGDAPEPWSAPHASGQPSLSSAVGGLTAVPLGQMLSYGMSQAPGDDAAYDEHSKPVGFHVVRSHIGRTVAPPEPGSTAGMHMPQVSGQCAETVAPYSALWQ